MRNALPIEAAAKSASRPHERHPEQTLLDWHERLSIALARNVDPAAALAALCDEIRTLLPCDRVQIWRGDVRQMTMTTLISSGYGDAEAARLAALVMPIREMPAFSSDFLTEKVAVVPRTASFVGYGDEMFRSFGIEAAVFLLLERGDRVLGAMQLSWCTSPDPYMPSPDVIEAIRRHAGLAVDFLARTDQALQLSENLSETAILLGSIHDPDELLEAMAGKIADAVGCEWAAVYLVHEETRTLELVAIEGLELEDRTPLAGAALDLAEEWIAGSEDGVIEVVDVRATPELAHWVGSLKVSSYVSLPLVDETRLVGFLTLGYRTRTGHFSRRQIALAKGLTHHALVALRNARLVRSLREANQVKADFIAAVSHDMRTPLHVLIGYNGMLLEGAAGDLNEAQRDLVARMHGCSVRFLDMIDGVLDLGRLEAGRNVVTLAPVQIAELCRQIVREVDYLRHPGVELRCNAAEVTATLDASKLATILRNLMTNALKFTHDGFVELHAGMRGKDHIVLQVRDTGPGIRPDERPKVFEMFRQGDAGLQAGGSGLGLGLYLVKRLTESLRGTVDLVSAEPGRTVFEVVLPIGPS
jgi:signal transduction histidine kinase